MREPYGEAVATRTGPEPWWRSCEETTRGFVEFVLSGAAVFTKHGLITPAQARKGAAETAKKPTKKTRKRSPKKKR